MRPHFAPYRSILLTASVALSCLLIAAPATTQEAHREILAEKFRTELRRISGDLPGVMGIAVADLSMPRTRPAAPACCSTSAMAPRGSRSATNLLIDRLGMESVNGTMQELGLPSIRLQRKMIRPEESARGNENLATPADAAALMTRIARCNLPISAAHCAELRSILEIPKSGAFAGPLPADTQIAWKPGGIEGASIAWGVIALPDRPYAVAVMANYTQSEPAAEAIRKIAAASYAYCSRLAGSTPYGARVAPELLEKTPRPPER